MSYELCKAASNFKIENKIQPIQMITFSSYQRIQFSQFIESVRKANSSQFARKANSSQLHGNYVTQRSLERVITNKSVHLDFIFNRNSGFWY